MMDSGLNELAHDVLKLRKQAETDVTYVSTPLKGEDGIALKVIQQLNPKLSVAEILKRSIRHFAVCENSEAQGHPVTAHVPEERNGVPTGKMVEANVKEFISHPKSEKLGHSASRKSKKKA